ncbi:hypothetical protein MKW94_007431 [Papaver nudicaule]|uniref:Transposase Tnp1/En/Spm-like domain-containing protein n=1 Tax=Papaver nudicaule TaxID=74823 RepID=A0AA41W064_PAPNU|nr:hypothetical protein [Papaver nudicaule]
MRSKRLELQEALKNKSPSVTKRQKKSSTTKPRAVSVNGQRAKEVETEEVEERLNVVAPEKQRSPTTKQCSAIANGSWANKIASIALEARLNAVALKKQRSSKTTPRIASVDGSRENQIVTDAEDERLNVVALEKQRSSTKKPSSASLKGRKAKEIVTDAVDERLNTVAIEKQRSSATKPSSASVDGQRAKEIKQKYSTKKPRVAFVDGPRSPTTTPCYTFVNGSRANEIVMAPVDERLKAVDDMLDSGDDIRDEDADTLDTWSDNRDEDADILDSDGNCDVQIVEDQSLPTNSGEDADIFDANGASDMKIEEDQSSTDSDEDADILDAHEGSGTQIGEDQSLSANSEEVAGSSRKRKRDNIQRQITDPHSEFNNPSGNRKLIIFDIYGRPCDVGSQQFATDIGKTVRAHCPPAIKSWRVVSNSIKENIWKYLVAQYVVPEVYKPSVLSRAGCAWKKWKSQLRTEMDKYETISERKINMPERFISKREDWENFVDFCNTDEDRKRRARGKKANEAMEFVSACGRKGIYRKIYDMEKESPTGEVNRSAIFLDTHISKTINDPESSSPSDIKMRLIKELVEAYPDGQKDIENDAVALVCGRDSRGYVRGMGGGVSRTQVRLSATVVETLRKVQEENKRLQSDNQSLLAQSGKHTQNHISTPSNQSVSNIQNRTSTPSYESASQAPDASHSPAPSCLAPSVCALPARSRLAAPTSNLRAHSRLVPLASNLSRMTPLASNLAASSCFIKNFKGRTIALGSFNIAEPPMEHVHSLIIEDIFDRDAELFDQDGKLGDIMIGGVINWPKACVQSNLPADSCFIRNFKRRTIGFGSFSTPTDPQMEHVYSVIVKEIYDRNAELFDTDGKLGDIRIGGTINWPKACVKPCRQ